MNDKIWFTYKARIQAQMRLAQLDFHSQLLLVWYAMLSTALSVTAIKYPLILGGDTDVVSAVLAILLLGVSLAVANRDFRGRSIAMQRNYMELQRLYDSIKLAGTVNAACVAQYHDLLGNVENHQEIDDKTFRVLQRKTLTSRQPTNVDVVVVYGYIASKYIAILAFYLVPLALWYFT